jgi:hypothetical protein
MIVEHETSGDFEPELSEGQRERLSGRFEDLADFYHTEGTVCAICSDTADDADIGVPPVFATGERCNHIFHQHCLQQFIAARWGAAYRHHASNRCPTCRAWLSRCIPVPHAHFDFTVDERTAAERLADITGLMDESFEVDEAMDL